LKEGFLSGTHEFVIQSVFFVLMLVAIEVGFRLGRKAEASTKPATKSQIAIVEAACWALSRSCWHSRCRWRCLGLMLASNLCSARSTPSARPVFVRDSCPHQTAPRSRVFFAITSRSGPSMGAWVTISLRSTIRTRKLRICRRNSGPSDRLCQKDPNPVKAGLLLQSLNEAIDWKRPAGRHSKITFRRM
jgi:hypothetical protein